MRALLIALTLAGCYADLFKATGDFATVTKATATDLGGVTGVLERLCRKRAQADYMTRQLNPSPPAEGWEAFFRTTPIAEGETTWDKRCRERKEIEEVYDKILTGIASYGTALSAAANDTAATDLGIADFDKAAAAAVAKIPAASGYKDAMKGIADPLSALTKAIVSLASGARLASILDATDADFTKQTQLLSAYLDKVKSVELRAVREAQGSFLKIYRGKQAIAAAVLDAQWGSDLDDIEERIDSFKEELAKLASAHSTLKHGWDHRSDSKVSREDAVAVGRLTVGILEAIICFKKGDK